MKNKFKKENGYIDGDTIIGIFYILIIVGVITFGIYKFINSKVIGNKTMLDTKNTYEKAIINLNGEKFEIDVDTWSDYEGEQIQIIGKDGQVYLVSSFNTILIGK